MARARAKRCWHLQKKGAITFDYGNNIRAQAKKAGVRKRLRYSRASFRNTSARFFAKGKGRFAGWR